MTNTINIVNNSNIENKKIKKVIELLGRKFSMAWCKYETIYDF